jgi:LuxR family maltose regulon positive regulatory protein
LSGPLCDAVTGQDGGQGRLAALERGNLFLVPLDDHRHWYRYHRLFADVLQAHLLDEQPAAVPELHQRASIWYEQNGEPAEAIDHALAAEDFERAADLIELAIPELRRDRREATLRRWLKVIPDELLRVRPVLNIGFVGALVSGGQLEGIKERLRDAEQWLDAGTAGSARSKPPSSDMVVRDLEELPRLPGTIEMYRAALALVAGDRPGTVMHAKRAIDLSPEEDQLPRAGAAVLMGLAFWGGGDLEEQGIRRTPNAWRDCGGQATSPTRSGVRSPWRISGSRKVVSATRCVRMSRPSSFQWGSVPLSKAGRCCVGQQTCTSV